MRIGQILRDKTPVYLTRVTVVLVVAAVSVSLFSCSQTKTASSPTPGQSAATNPVTEMISASPDMTMYQTSYDKVTIEFLSDNIGFKPTDNYETTDLKTVAYIDSVISNSMTSSDAKETDLKNNSTNAYSIKLSNKMGGYSAGLYYDTLYNKAYIVNNGGLWQAKTDFARYIDSLLENSPVALMSEDAEAVDLFKSYGWTLDYRMNGMENKLNDLRVLSGFNPNAYYFAYNNELSKDIRLDMSGYSNTADVEVDIYKIHEPMPQEFYPIINCRGIVVKSGGKIIGAFISAGRHSTFNACSLNGRSFEDVTGQTVNEWLAGMVKGDQNDEWLSKLEPEQVIREYFTALANKDAEIAECCVSKQTLLGNLTINMTNDELFNEGIGLPLTCSLGGGSSFDNLISITQPEVYALDEPEKSIKRFCVNFNIQYRTVISIDSGEQSWDCTMVFESPQTGWKIQGFGHG